MSSTPTEPEEEPEDGGDNTDEPVDIDEAFNAIVSGIRHGDRPPEVPIWPVAEDVGATDTDATPGPDPGPAPPLGSQWAGWEDVAPPATADELDGGDGGEDADGFVPPPPPPIPKGDPVLRWAWAGAVGAPLAAVVLAFAGWNFGGLVGLGLVSAFLAGFVTLVSRLRSGPRDEDNPDDGAVV